MGLKRNHFKLSLRSRLTLSYISLIIFSLLILGAGYYYKSSDVISQNASQTLLGILMLSNQSLNAKFASVEQNAINMHLDEDLYHFFNTSDLQKRYFNYENDRKIARIIQKYFVSTEDKYSVNLVTKEYTFGGNPNFWIPKTNYADSNIYSIGIHSTESTSWIPTYNLIGEFYPSSPVSSDNAQLVFTAARQLNLSLVANNLLRPMGEFAERPVLIVNFRESMIRKALQESLWIKGSYYYVLTENRELVSTSKSFSDPVPISQEWVQRALKERSGTKYVDINGQKMLAVFDTIDVTGWLSAVFIPYNQLLITVPNMTSYTIYSTIVMIILAIVLASLISGRIILPIKKLMWGIKQSGEGNFHTKIAAVGTDEFDVIIHKFNEMNENIQALIQENYQIHLKEMEAELKALSFQFNPHFLYNTLNIINCLAIENKPGLVSDMLVELSEMLEYTAKNPGEVIFSEDLKYLKNYVNIMERRFEGKFQVEYEIEPELLHTSVPKFFLQPFIENAIIHGLEHTEEGGWIKVSGWTRGNTRFFTIEDNGKGMDAETVERVLEAPESAKSIGIDNINKRIKFLYGYQYGVKIESEVNAGTTITITLGIRQFLQHIS